MQKTLQFNIYQKPQLSIFWGLLFIVGTQDYFCVKILWNYGILFLDIFGNFPQKIGNVRKKEPHEKLSFKILYHFTIEIVLYPYCEEHVKWSFSYKNHDFRHLSFIIISVNFCPILKRLCTIMIGETLSLISVFRITISKMILEKWFSKNINM